MTDRQSFFSGAALAVLACIIWSGNFIVARAVIHQVPPVTLALIRWSLATLVLLPFSIRPLLQQRRAIRERLLYFCCTAICGVTVFNTFLYIAAHTTSAINMALIGTCSSPVFSVILAAMFLKERVTGVRIGGMLLMLSGILFLLARGNIQNLASFRFTPGDLWVLGAAVFFAFYNILVRKKPASVSAAVFLFTTFSIGTIFLVPFSAWEMQHSPGIEWNTELVMVVLYLGLGTSVVAFLLWNFSIARLGAARTALFGNLIPLFSSVEAVLLLDEQITVVHIASAVLIIAGLLIANSRKQKRIPVYSADN